MEKKTRSSRKDPASSSYRNARNQGDQGHMRQSRTLADATDPRTPARRHDDFEPDYSARDEQAPSMPQRLTLPSIPSVPAVSHDSTRHRRGNRQSSWDEYARNGEDWSASGYPGDDNDDYDTGRSRAHSVARPLALVTVRSTPRISRWCGKVRRRWR